MELLTIMLRRVFSLALRRMLLRARNGRRCKQWNDQEKMVEPHRCSLLSPVFFGKPRTHRSVALASYGAAR